MADKHILLTFISPHATNTSKDRYGKIYYNTLGPSIQQIYKDGKTLSHIIVFTSPEVLQESIPCTEEKKPISPYNLFKEFCNEIDNSIQVSNFIFNEDKLFADNVSSIINAVNLIKKITSKEDEIYIHIDTTPGFRNASMLLSSITQLLSLNSNVHIDEVVYYKYNRSTAYVEQHSSTEIYNISKLSAGAEAFVKYGSTEVLEDYFKDKKYPRLELLLKAMKGFAEALRICSASLLDQKIQNLKENIDLFEKETTKFEATEFNAYEKLFSVFLEKIKDKYKKLFDISSGKRSIQLLNRIEWCIDNRYIQQAITLATEWIPEILVSNKIFYFKDKNDIEYAQEEAKKSYDPIEKFFIISYKRKEYNYQKRFKCLLNNQEAYTDIDESEAINLCRLYSRLAQRRNDINHINNTADFKEILDQVRSFLDKIRNITNSPAKPIVRSQAEQKINDKGRDIDRNKKTILKKTATQQKNDINSRIRTFFGELSAGTDNSEEFFAELSKYSKTDADNLRNFMSAIKTKGWKKAISNGDYAENICKQLFLKRQKYSQFSHVCRNNKFEDFMSFMIDKFDKNKFYKLMRILGNEELKNIFLLNNLSGGCNDAQ